MKDYGHWTARVGWMSLLPISEVPGDPQDEAATPYDHGIRRGNFCFPCSGYLLGMASYREPSSDMSIDYDDDDDESFYEF